MDRGTGSPVTIQKDNEKVNFHVNVYGCIITNVIIPTPKGSYKSTVTFTRKKPLPIREWLFLLRTVLKRSSKIFSAALQSNLQGQYLVYSLGTIYILNVFKKKIKGLVYILV